MKSDAKEFIVQLLEDAGCRGIKPSKSDIHASCPFHNPRFNTTAFGVSYTEEDLGYPYNCNSCGEKGNLAQLTSFITGKSYKGALKVIRRSVYLKPITIGTLKAGLLGLNKAAQSIIGKNPAITLPDRSFNQEPMFNYLRKRSKMYHKVVDVDHIVNRYRLYYCSEGRMAGRIVMPIYLAGTLVGINDRSVADIRNKSLHGAGADFSDLLYGIEESAGKRVGVITEGGFDMYQCVSTFVSNKRYHGYGSVALMGTVLNEAKAGLIAENFEEAIVMLDNDNDTKTQAGVKGSFKVAAMLRDFMPTKNVTLEIPEGKDPGKCTSRQIIKAVESQGYQHKTMLGEMQKWATN